MYTSQKIRELANISFGEGNFQEVLLKVLADLTERLECLQWCEDNNRHSAQYYRRNEVTKPQMPGPLD